jgi:ATP-dependent 26S proteasome regulatory subunit
VEEVAEFLRRIPEAIKNRVLIVAMTNRIEMIDPAILRRGRFDHVIKVDMASTSEILALLVRLVGNLPGAEDIALERLAASLDGRPLSDVAFVVKEAARLAARAGQNRMTQEFVDAAMKAVPAREGGVSRRKIGFI